MPQVHTDDLRALEHNGSELLLWLRLRSRDLHASSDAPLQVLHDEHRSTLPHAVHPHHDWLLSTPRGRGEDLARHLRITCLHRLLTHDCR